jgi:beta-galactosidase GanA
MPPIPPYFGAAYYPEAWPVEQIDADIALMKQAGMNVMRIGEFAWRNMEPAEGKFDFAWLHHVIDRLGAAGIGTILCTPTCTPPAWLTYRYPEIRIVTANLRPIEHGGRRHGCPTSPVYREHCARIVTAMAKEFGQDSNVIGWQIDNELFMERDYGGLHGGCFCPSCSEGFTAALREQFGDIAKLNAAWGTALWSQTYDSFEQVAPPHGQAWHHPSLEHAWMAYQGDCYIDFAAAQADILHALVTQPVGTDMMPTNGLDYTKMNRPLDVVQFNHYNTMENLWDAAFWMDHVRTLKPAPFWNTETSTCWNGGTYAMGYRPPGFCRVNSWLPIALGGEANLYWLWRAHWSGQELMHGSVVSSAGRPLHSFGEVQEVGEGFAKAAPFLNGTRPVSTGLALHLSGHAWWMFKYQPMVEKFEYASQLQHGYHRPMTEAQLRPDVIDPSTDLSGYRMVCSPFLATLEEGDFARRILDWVQAGGVWVVGPLSDIRTFRGTKYTHAPYGHLEEWAGVYCRYEIPASPREFGISWVDGRSAQGSVWYDALELRGAEALAMYTEGPMAGMAAVTRRQVGKGQIVLLGTLPCPADLRPLLRDLAGQAGIAPVAEASPNVLVVPRQGPAGKGAVVVELSNTPGHVTLPGPMLDLLTGRRVGRHLDLSPCGVSVLQEIK